MIFVNNVKRLDVLIINVLYYHYAFNASALMSTGSLVSEQFQIVRNKIRENKIEYSN